MRPYRPTERFSENLSDLPRAIREKFFKQLALLRQDLRHPSLRVKKMHGHRDIYEARVDYHYRFTFHSPT